MFASVAKVLDLNMKGHTMFIPPQPNDVDVLVDWLKSLLK
jgi:hypothetical protein